MLGTGHECAVAGLHGDPLVLGAQGGQVMAAETRSQPTWLSRRHACRHRFPHRAGAHDPPDDRHVCTSADVPATITRGLVRECHAAFARLRWLGPGDLCAVCSQAATVPPCALLAPAGERRPLHSPQRRRSARPPGRRQDWSDRPGWGPTYTNDTLADDRLPSQPWLREHGLGLLRRLPPHLPGRTARRAGDVQPTCHAAGRMRPVGRLRPPAPWPSRTRPCSQTSRP